MHAKSSQRNAEITYPGEWRRCVPALPKFPFIVFKLRGFPLLSQEHFVVEKHIALA